MNAVIEAAYKKELAAEFEIAPEEIASSALPPPETQPTTNDTMNKPEDVTP